MVIIDIVVMCHFTSVCSLKVIEKSCIYNRASKTDPVCVLYTTTIMYFHLYSVVNTIVAVVNSNIHGNTTQDRDMVIPKG